MGSSVYLQPTDRDRSFSVGQAAAICHCAARTVSKWCDTHGLRHYRLEGGRHRRIPRSALIEFMLDRKMPVPEWALEETVVWCVDGTVPEVGPFRFVGAACGVEVGMFCERYRPRACVLSAARLCRSECLSMLPFLRRDHPGMIVLVVPTDDDSDPKPWVEAGASVVCRQNRVPETLTSVLTTATKEVDHV